MSAQNYTYGPNGFAGERAMSSSFESQPRDIWPRTDMSVRDELRVYSIDGTTYIGKQLMEDALRPRLEVPDIEDSIE